jgi:hypothetical protein
VLAAQVADETLGAAKEGLLVTLGSDDLDMS